MCGQADGDCAHRAALLPTLGRQRTYISPTVREKTESPIAQKGTVHCYSECELRLWVFVAPGEMPTGLLPGAIRIVQWNKFAPQSLLVIYTPLLESRGPALSTLSSPFFHSRATVKACFLQRKVRVARPLHFYKVRITDIFYYHQPQSKVLLIHMEQPVVTPLCHVTQS